MGSDLQKELAEALKIVIKPPCPVQELFNSYKKFMSGKQIVTPVETVHLLDENFPYWIKLENPDPSRKGKWIGAKSNEVVPLLQAGTFRSDAFRYDDRRANALLWLPTLLRNPNCIHENLRHAERNHGGIQGRHLYVEYYKGKTRKVAFTTLNYKSGNIVPVTSFLTHPNWIMDCAKTPAAYVRPGSKCTCC